MKSWFAANIDTNKGLSGPFYLVMFPPFARVAMHRLRRPPPWAAHSAPPAVGLLTENSVKESGFKNHQTDPECPLGLE